MLRTCKATFTAIVIAGGLFPLTAQVAPKRSVDVTVTEPNGRTVTGLEKDQFAITEGGVQRTITAFSQTRDEKPKVVVHYRLEFESTGAGDVRVVLKRPSGMPNLDVKWTVLPAQ